MKSLIFFAQTFTISSTNWQTWSALLPVSTSKFLTYISKFWPLIFISAHYQKLVCNTGRNLLQLLHLSYCFLKRTSCHAKSKRWQELNSQYVVLFTCFQGLTVWRYRLNPTDYSVGLRLWSTDNFFWNNKFSKN